ncbi:MAG: cytosine deaminase, partial [Devosia sp.]
MKQTQFPDAATVVLRNATLPRVVLTEESASGQGQLISADMLITDGKIGAIAAPGTLAVPDSAAIWDCRNGIILPAFADIHTHLDKGHIWPRSENPDGSFMGALEAAAADRDANWAADDVERRMDFALRCAYAHGTAAIRTHLDSAPPQHEISWDVFDRMRERWAGRIELQATALVGP